MGLISITSVCVCVIVSTYVGGVWVHVYVYMGECSTYSGEFRLSPSVVRSLERNRSTHTLRVSHQPHEGTAHKAHTQQLES